jgi:hypothetical protein
MAFDTDVLVFWQDGIIIVCVQENPRRVMRPVRRLPFVENLEISDDNH